MDRPALVLAAHGTRSEVGLATTRELADAVRERRRNLQIELCYLDVLGPSLRETLTAIGGSAVVVPALLSVGYHVNVDIPQTAADFPAARVARHLGPDPLLTAALVARLAEARGSRPVADSAVLLAAGSSDPAALDDLAAAATDLARALGRPVQAATLAERPTEALRPGVEVATYLLAEGFFADTVRARCRAAGVETVAAPIGALPSVVDLVLARYDEAVT